MCGILGIVSKENIEVKQNRFKQMLRSMAHRGPDGEGFLFEDKCYLGHNRLSIIDLSESGKQPMCNEDGNIWITFNGEIYNFQSLKRILIKRGHKFRSNTDTEVIIHLYEDEGIDCLRYLEGMFGFYILDLKNKKGYLVRDRLGIKPVYYSFFDKAFIFSSEIKGILGYPGFEKSLNLLGVSSYLSYRYTLEDETLFENVFSLSPACYIQVDLDSLTTKKFRYWALTKKKPKIKDVRKNVELAVTKRMVADVPVGAYLSGGLDSSVVVAVMANQCNNLKTFTVGFKESNEFDYAKKVSDRYRLDHKEVIMTQEEYFDTVLKLIRYKDLPLSMPNEIPLYIMSKELKKDITVVLSGEGADEIFMGYGRLFRSPLDYKKLKVIRWFGKRFYKRVFPHLYEKYEGKFFRNRLEHFLHQYSYFPLEEKESIFKKEMVSLIDKDNRLKRIFEKEFKNFKGNYYQQVSYIFLKLHLPGLLQRLDGCTMANSVEGRVPFVDHKLIENIFNIPPRKKLRLEIKGFFRSLFLNSDQISEAYDTPKYCLKKTFEGDLPHENIYRKKVGFPVPLTEWFETEYFKSLIEKDLFSEDAHIKRFIDQDKLRRWMNEKEGKDKDFGQKLWRLLNLEMWMREYGL